MIDVVVAIPHSHTWFWTQTCLSSLIKFPPKAQNCSVRVIVVNNSPWSPAINGMLDTSIIPTPFHIYVITNQKSNKFHASALDTIVESFDFDYLMALETDVMALSPNWLEWFFDQMRRDDFAVGAWHHERFVNPSCTLYRGDVLRRMMCWCKDNAPQDELRWGPNFSKTAPLDNNLPLSENPAAVLSNLKSWIGGTFAEKRGWPEGTTLNETPSGQEKGAGWYEPGQQLHHWAVQDGYSYKVCPTATTKRDDGLPLQTIYGDGSLDYYGKQMEASDLIGRGQTVHFWGGTRALDILKHPVTCEFVKSNTPMWLAREARFWKQMVEPKVQTETLDLIRKYGWYITGQGTDYVTDRDKEAAEYVRKCYAEGGVEW